MPKNYSNTAIQTSLASVITSTSPSITVGSTAGFPAVQFTLVLDPGTAREELVLVTAVAGTSLSVTRGYDGTTAVGHDTGAVIQHSHSAIDFATSRAHEAATADVHGVTGGLVGAANTQALTNKDLTSATNTFPPSLATDAEITSAVATHNTATVAHGATGAVVGTTNTQALTNKDLSSGTNTFPASLATDAEVAAHSGLTAAHGATGAVVGTTNAQTLTNKTLTSPAMTDPTASGSLTGFGGAWNVYTPTMTAWGVGNGTLEGFHFQIGKTIHYRIEYTAGSTSTFAGNPRWALPLPAAGGGLAALPVVGQAALWDVSATGRRFFHTCLISSSTVCPLDDSGVGLSVTLPWAWAPGDIIVITGEYEAA